MTEKSKILLSLGAALASLTGMSVQGAEAKSVSGNGIRASAAESPAIKLEPMLTIRLAKTFLDLS
jgi:hypothetical protein